MQHMSESDRSGPQRPAGVPLPFDGFEVEVTSSTSAARQALERVLEELEPLGLDSDEVNTVELVLAEVLNNIVEHAYADTSGPIYIGCQHEKNGLHLVVRDKGEEMPDGRTPLGQMESLEQDVSALPEGGFGWFLIKDLAKDVKYRRAGDENQLNLRIAVAYGRPN
ncbi:putative serine-protein kinase [Sulfitobacter noctilucicola]|uniref:Serine/threonine-protein kinase RsbW n=1 Tax=Sulfitobacter noctilucicola TaxID=1342301 RepID=A0A7W6Q295_9RHOB|nr:ATP-binding protein [Sulfitobacter noctilucicola]KIN63146.1 putative serine-protein kinase [Sulfitobacter noctilucicola]MBB4172328.1 serine/threonine-protein kinase RsbW [Sulfitobacter noctilucicola]